MQIISVRTRCKINLGLEILTKRRDGYHDLNTVFQHVSLGDDITITIEPTGRETHVTCPALPDLAPENNLVYKACEVLRDRTDFQHSIGIHLHKLLPHGAGLGGGSGNAAAVLRALQATIAKQVTDNELHELASILGADVPLFLSSPTTIGTGTGVQLTPTSLCQEAYEQFCVIVTSSQHIATPAAFAACTPRSSQAATKLDEVVRQPVATWKDSLTNDFESSIFASIPALKETKSTLYEKGARFALMSGSGSAVFGLFDTISAAEAAKSCFENKALLGSLVRP